MIREKSLWYSHMPQEKWKDTYPECSFYEYFRNNSLAYPSLPAIEFEGKQITYRSMVEQITEIAHSLWAIGIRPGDTVSIVSPNTPQALFTVYAVNRIGAVSNMIHPLLSASEIQQFIESTASAAILTLDMIYPKFAKMRWNTDRKPKIILSHIVDALPWYKKAVYSVKNPLSLTLNPDHDVLLWKCFLDIGKKSNVSLPQDSGAGDDTAVILYSGGSTGTPKGVMITNRNINALALHTYDIGGIVDVVGKKSLALMPLFHGFGLVICAHAMLCLGFHVFLLPKYDFKACSNLIFKKRINCIYGVPGLYEALIRTPQIDTSDLSFMDLLVCGGDKLPERLRKRVNACLKQGGANATLQEAYGQTECVAGCSINPKFDTRVGSAGIAYPDVYFKVVVPGTDIELPTGEIGELCVRGPIVMKGYYQNPEATAQVLKAHKDGNIWLHTGDLFSMDSDGYIYFCQRSSRMLVCGGYNIYMTQIENVVSSCPSVAQCCVIGIRDRLYGQKIGVCVVPANPNADKASMQQQIMEKCRHSMAEYSLPHEFFFRDSLPLTNMGKIDYLALEQEYNTKRSKTNA